MTTITTTRTRWKTTALGLCFATALLAGCGDMQGEAENVSSTKEAVLISPSGLPGATQIQYGTMWQFDMAGPVPLNWSNGSCYLTSVWGKYASFNDSVQIGWNGVTFYVSGSHGSGTPAADVFCQSAPGVFSGSWRGGQSTMPANLGSAATRSCYLTGLSGNFTATGAEIRLRVVGGNWLLDGTGAVAASAICINATPFPSVTFTASDLPGQLMPGSNGQTTPGAVNFSPDGPYFCGLTGVKGFLLDKSWVGMYLFSRIDQGSPPIWEWHLGGKNVRPFPNEVLLPLTGTGHCNF